MMKARTTAEPEVEDLLASIRKAIADQSSLGFTAQRQSPVISGSMRELRLRPSEAEGGDRRAGEIHTLRDKISTRLGRKETGAAEPSPPSPINGFAGILGGDPSMMAKTQAATQSRAAEPLPLRESLARIEAASDQDYGAVHALPPAQAGPDTRQDDRHRYAEPHPSWNEPAAPRYAPPAELRGSRSAFPSEPAMLSQDTAAAASSAFNRLAETLMARATGERPIEDITRELLRSMLKQWLDEHLPAMVERMVREEIERVARRGPLR